MDTDNHIEFNPIVDIRSRNSLFDTISLLEKKRNNSFEKIEIDISKRDNLMRRAKRIPLESLLQFDNDIIKKTYNYNIGNGIHKKILYKNSHFQIKRSDTIFNINLLKKPHGDILSEKITSKFTNIPLDHNKTLINQLKNEKDEDKKELPNEMYSNLFFHNFKK